MATTAEKVKGTQLKVTISASLTLVPQCFDIKPTGYSNDPIDITSIDSSVMEKDFSISEASQITATVIWNPANSVHIQLQTWSGTPSTIACEVVFPGAVRYQFNAYVASFDFVSGGVKDVHKRTLVLQPTGAITVA